MARDRGAKCFYPITEHKKKVSGTLHLVQETWRPRKPKVPDTFFLWATSDGQMDHGQVRKPRISRQKPVTWPDTAFGHLTGYAFIAQKKVSGTLQPQ